MTVAIVLAIATVFLNVIYGNGYMKINLYWNGSLIISFSLQHFPSIIFITRQYHLFSFVFLYFYILILETKYKPRIHHLETLLTMKHYTLSSL